MKRILGIVSFCTISAGSLFSQSIERDVYNASGSVTQAGGITLFSNVGEPLTRNYFQTAQGRILTEGFIQPDIKDLTAGMTEENKGIGMVIWPNPTTEGLTLSFASPATETYTATVFDMAGKQVRLETLCTGCSNHYISFADLANGMYVLRVSQGNASVQEFKFIKMTP